VGSRTSTQREDHELEGSCRKGRHKLNDEGQNPPFSGIEVPLHQERKVDLQFVIVAGPDFSVDAGDGRLLLEDATANPDRFLLHHG
jgi:hypothetical protein